MARDTKKMILQSWPKEGARPEEVSRSLDLGLNATYLALSDLERSGMLRRDNNGRYHLTDAAEEASREALN